MLRLITLLTLTALLTVAPAQAEPPADPFRAEAARLLTLVKRLNDGAAQRGALKPQPLAADLVLDLQKFGMSASRIAVDISARGGPLDLGCIFRGMAEETGVQLDAAGKAATGADQAVALRRLSSMLQDAIEIAPAAQNVIAASPKGPAATATCPAARNF